jgi:hypothetical protein
MSAQIRAGEYIAGLQPTAVMLGTIRNTLLPDYVTYEEQGFYDTVTGYDNPAGMDKRVPEIPGHKTYGSMFGFIGDVHGVDQAVEAAINISEKIGGEAVDVVPYYHTVMQLRGSEIPFVNHDFISDASVYAGEDGAIVKAGGAFRDAEKMVFASPEGVQNLEKAIVEYREVARSQAEKMKATIRSGIKKLPSVTNEDGAKIVILTDNPMLYGLRKEQPSKKVQTIVRCFASLGIVDSCAGTKQVMSLGDFPVFSNAIDAGLHLPPETDDKYGITQRLVGARLGVAMIDAFGLSDHELLNAVFADLYVAVKGRDKSVRFYEAVRDIASDVQAGSENFLAGADEQKAHLLAAGYLKRMITETTKIVGW